MHAQDIRNLNDNSQYPLDKHPLYSRDADRPTSKFSSACSTPRSLNSYTSGATDVSPGRLLIPRDIQSPSHVIAQIKGAHKQLLYLSRNNFVQPAADGPDQSQAFQARDWQRFEEQQQQDHHGLDRISESSDSTYMECSQADTPQSSASMQSRYQDLQHSNDMLTRQLHAARSDMEEQQHEHFKFRQEQHLQLEDLRSHISHLQHELEGNQSSTTELLSVNTFLDTQLKKHKDQLHSARQSTLRYHRQLQQGQQERDEVNTQLQDARAQLSKAQQERKQQQQLVADLHQQAASAAEHKAKAQQLTATEHQLTSANEKLDKVKQELLAANQDKQQLGKTRDSLTEDLQEVNQQLLALQSALTEAFQEQDVVAKKARHQLVAQHAQQARTAADKLSAATNQSQQLQAQVSALADKDFTLYSLVLMMQLLPDGCHRRAQQMFSCLAGSAPAAAATAGSKLS